MSSVKKTRGFTLIELVVVIVVIAIIAGIVLVSFRGIQSRARDDRRLADMSVIVKSLDAYKSFNQSYPAVIASGPVSYTHLDVYKRQILQHALSLLNRTCQNLILIRPTRYIERIQMCCQF